MEIAKEPYPTDTTVEVEGLKIFLDIWADNMLKDATIDYSRGYGFTISGASEHGSCCS